MNEDAAVLPATEPERPEINLVKLDEVKPEYRHLCTPDLFLAKEGCRHCYGRGWTGLRKAELKKNGIVTKSMIHEWCRCVMVNMNALADRMTRAREAWLKEHPNDLMKVELAPAPGVEDGNPKQE